MLQVSQHIQTRETAVTMGNHIARLEVYVSTISNLQRLEDARPEYNIVDLQSFISFLYESADVEVKL